jgi:hypothetical protein
LKILQKPIITFSVGVGSALLIGTVKEFYDYYDYGNFNLKDLGATVLGGAVGSFTITYTINNINDHGKR